ncbi:uncharacterized protein LOC103578407 [Microplitis demolitor]|uniref:uncharacterized protein LOC103578407 n=1 Tax=Microplitis demolitor TaxID=69319 RepID=UPI0004CD22CA|nr:uncharacterized protein LOC103578407 [Microplitis demolitor]
MPVPLHSDSTSNIKNDTKEYGYLKNIDIIIWDEAPMAPRHKLELVNRTLCDIMNNDLPFGGKIVVLGGDFRQLLPIKVNATRSETINLSIKFSSSWKCFTKFTLTHNMRALPEEKEFVKFLLTIGNVTSNNRDDYADIPENCIPPNNSNIVHDIYGDLIKNKHYDDFTKVAILSPRDADVNEINDQVIDLLDVTTEKNYTTLQATRQESSLTSTISRPPNTIPISLNSGTAIQPRNHLSLPNSYISSTLMPREVFPAAAVSQAANPLTADRFALWQSTANALNSNYNNSSSVNLAIDP